MHSANTQWRLLSLVFLLVVVTSGLLAVAATGEAEGECSANDDSCAADIDIDNEPAEELTLTQCKDTHEECKHWASVGECDANPNYMRGKLTSQKNL